VSEGLTGPFLVRAVERMDADIAEVEELLTRLRTARSYLAGDTEVDVSPRRPPPSVRDASLQKYRGGTMRKYEPLVIEWLRANPGSHPTRVISGAVQQPEDVGGSGRGAESTVRRVLDRLAQLGVVEQVGSSGYRVWQLRREEPPSDTVAVPEAPAEELPAPGEGHYPTVEEVPQEEPQEEEREEEEEPPPPPPPPAPEPEKPEPEKPSAEQPAARSDFLAGVPPQYRKLEDIRSAIRGMEGSITKTRLMSEWGIAVHQATRVITQMAKEGVIRVAGMPGHGEAIPYTTADQGLFDRLPQASVSWTEMPSWKTVTNRDTNNEIAARAQNAILSVMERGRSWVSSEIAEELSEFDLAQAYIAQQLRAMDKAAVIRRVGMRRGRKQEAGRPAIEYAAPNARPTLVTPAKEKQEEGAEEEKPSAPIATKAAAENDAVRVWLDSNSPFTGRQLADAFGQTTGWAGLLIGRMSAQGIVRRMSDGRWTVKERLEQPEPESEQEPVAEDVKPQLLVTVRDWVQKQPEGDVFSPAKVAEAAKVNLDQAESALRVLTERGVATDESPTPELKLYAYAGKPKEPGRAAELDMARRKEEPPVAGSEPVPGTGRGLRISDKDVNALVQKAVSLGAKVSQLGDGHFSVTRPGRTGSVTVAGTPSRPAIERIRKRMRTELGLAI
jgi:ribosomal protein S25